MVLRLKGWRAWLGIVACVALHALAVFAAYAEGAGRMAQSAPAPRLVLWAWSRSDDLSFLARTPAPHAIDVAFLSGELLLQPSGLHVHPRLRPLRLPSDIERTAVAFVDVSRRHRRPLSAADIERLATRLRALPLMRDAERLQLNFEAVHSRRGEWQALVSALRRQMPAHQHLDAAVLADWCMDPAFAPADVERVVPMLYRLGPRSPALERVLSGAALFPSPACGDAIGIATDELERVALPLLARARWIYVFGPQTWTDARTARVQAHLAPVLGAR